MPNFCTHCGNPLSEGAVFCSNCGARIDPSLQQSKQIPQEVSDQVKSQIKQEVDDQVKPQIKQEVIQQIRQLTGTMAPSQTGEVDLGMTDVKSALKEGTAVLSPFSQVLSGIPAFFKGMRNAFKDRNTLLFSIVIGLLWIILSILNRNHIGGKVSGFLSWLTFANDGGKRGILGTAGRYLGQITVAGGLFSLITEARGIGSVKQWSGYFKDKSSLGTVLFGAGIAMMLYNFFVAKATMGDTMVAISGVILSLEALGSQNGFIFETARSLTAKKNGKSRIADSAKTNALLTGIGMGCALAVPLSAIRFGYIVFIIGMMLFIGGIVLNLKSGNKKGVSVA